MDFLVKQTFFGNQSKYMNNDLAGRKNFASQTEYKMKQI